MNKIVYKFITPTIIGLCLLLSGKTLAQPVILRLDQPNTAAGNYFARDAVVLKPGFSSHPLQPGVAEHFHAYIDKEIVYDADYLENPLPENRILDVSLAVGSINGDINTTSTGLLTYTIPLILTPGSNNVMPSLSLNYASQTDNGMMGIGWNLEGLSAIRRSPKNILMDGMVEGVKMTVNDKFSLDGNRLLVTSGTYGVDGSVYHTELETFVKITANGTNGSGPDWFLVETKDGRKIYYGHTTDSKVILPGINGVYNWLINRIEDNQGNYIDFKYVSNHNCSYIDEIKYTGNTHTGILPYNKVKFTYAARSDKNSVYVLGCEVKKEWLLNLITVTNDGNQTHKYKLDYFDGSIRNDYNTYLYSYLYQVTEFASDNNQYNSTLFKYDDVVEQTTIIEEDSQVTGFFPPPCPAYPEPETYPCDHITSRYNAGTRLYTGDFNGDGRDDYLTVNNSFNGTYEGHDGAYETRNGSCKMSINLSTPDGFHAVSINTFPCPIFGSPSYNQGYAVYDIKLLDYNGDGKMDILLKSNNFDGQNPSAGNPSHGTYNIKVLLSHGTSVNMIDVTPNGNAIPFFNTEIETGDFNGDRKTEILIISDVYTNYQTCKIIGENGYSYPFITHATPTTPNSIINFIFNCRDFNGDGKDEFMITGTVESKIYDPYATTQEIYSSTSITIDFANTFKFFPGDFNGDGKCDFLSFGPQGLWRFFYFNGQNFIISNAPMLNYSPEIGPVTAQNNIVRDFNGDGKSDILDIYETPNSLGTSTSFDIFYSNGNNGFVPQQAATTLIPMPSSSNMQYLHYGDFDGDGRVECSYNYFEKDPPATEFLDYQEEIAHNIIKITFPANHKKMLVKSITNGFNEKIEFSYKPLCYRESTGGQQGQDEIRVLNNTFSDPQIVYPLQYFNSSDYVLTSVKVDDGVGGFITKNFTYEDAILHKTGRGFLGFKKIITNHSTGEIAKKGYVLLGGVMNGVNLMQLENVTKEKPEGTIIESSHNQYIVSNTSAQGFFIYLSQNDFTDGLKQTNYRTTNTYNPADLANGNLTSETTEFITDNASVTKSYEYMSAGTWCPSKIQRISTVYQRTSVDPITKESTFDYYQSGSANAGLLKTAVINSNLPKPLTISYSSYDNYGNLLQTDFSATDIIPRSTQVVYDTRGRFVIRTINELGQITSDNITYDQKYGKVIKIKDIKGLFTMFQYNGFGMLKMITPPVGQKIFVNLVWSNGNPNNGSLYYKNTLSVGSAPVTEYFDYKQRCVQKVTRGFGGASIYSEIKYNNLGLLYSITEPHFSSASVINEEFYGYTPYYQCSTIVSPVKDISFVYTDNNITVTNNKTGQTTTKHFNSFNELSSVTEQGNTITYTTNSAGQTTKIDVSGTQTITHYDPYGHADYVTDPDAGTIQYVYNTLGELTSETDAKQNTSTMTYDNTGRIKTFINPEGTTEYNYDSQPHGEGDLAHIIGPNNISYDYYYDQFGRLSRESELIDGYYYNTDYEYNLFNQVSKITYPSASETTPFAIEKFYDSFGNLSIIKEATTHQPIYTNQSVNALGQIEQYLYGNNVSVYNTYDPHHHKIINMGALINGSPDIKFFYGYEYDPNTFMLNLRKDFINNKSETFTYDAVYDRLETITGSAGVPSSTIDYSANGNIERTSSVSSYAYGNNAGVHAVTRVPFSTYLAQDLQTVQTVEYTSYNKVSSIDENTDNLTFTYGPDFARKKTVRKQNGLTESTKYFLPNYEKEFKNGITRELHYIYGSDGLAAIYERLNNSTPGNMYYIHKDHLGSIIGATDVNGNVVTNTLASFDAWGNRRNPNTWQPFSTPPPELFFGRGFTGHEHLEQFGLINMNGRMYDPKVGRFLSPDIVNQAPDYSQSYNRYSYCLNNPLNMVDLNGYEYDDSGGDADYDPAEDNYDPYEGNGYYTTYWETGGNGGHTPGYQHLGRVGPPHWETYFTSYGGEEGVYVTQDWDEGNGQGGVQGDGDGWPPIWFYATWLEGPTITANANNASSSNPVQTINKVTNDVGIIIDAAEQTVQNTKVGANIAYAISGNSKVVSSVSNTFKVAPYVGLAVTAVAGYYLSTTKDPKTNRPYQSWTETGTDIGANIVIIYIGTQFGGWYGAGAAVLYIGLKCAIENPYEYYLPNGEINPGVQFIMNKE